ncbi:sporulation membrane protein YtrI [Bacillus alkalicellulosilyticus]|uniref:sporulation membrane protein YtrI n=1 Tax=Alkalihalobacterium alkalicellulosilyticum TaxID=1912214 RepID=UPI000996BE48|nr:sporulation membrane protein YtrI [Bacillus alkalicellulosilyticus]
MRIPPYYRRPGWQRFFGGVLLGMLIGWAFFVYNFGTIHEKLIYDIKMKNITIEEQKETIEKLRNEETRLNEEKEKRLTVQEIKITFSNDRQLKLNELTIYELQHSVSNELKEVKGKSISSVVETKELLLRSIENKVFEIGERKYRLIRDEMYIYTTLELHMKIEIVN